MRREPDSTAQRVFRIVLFVLLLPIILPLAILALLLHLLYKIVIYLLVWMWWLPRGKDVLYVTSDSPNWKEYMEAEIFPLVVERAVALFRFGRSMKGESQGKNFPGDWKKQKYSPCFPAHVKLEGSGVFSSWSIHFCGRDGAFGF